MDGCLVVAEFSRCEPGKTGKCPQCHPPHRMPRGHGFGETFSEHAGWIECEDCGFAILATDYERIMSEPFPFIGMGL